MKRVELMALDLDQYKNFASNSCRKWQNFKVFSFAYINVYGQIAKISLSFHILLTLELKSYIKLKLTRVLAKRTRCQCFEDFVSILYWVFAQATAWSCKHEQWGIYVYDLRVVLLYSERAQVPKQVLLTECCGFKSDKYHNHALLIVIRWNNVLSQPVTMK